MFSLKRKGDYQLQLTRILNVPGRYTLELYLFAPPEIDLSARTLAEQQFFFTSISHSFGLQANDRSSKSDDSYSLLSPHFEIAHGSWLVRYKTSMDRLRQQMQSPGLSAEPLSRALRLSQTFAQRMRRALPAQDRQKRYFRQMDIYFSWFAEQFFLECMTLEGYDDLDEELRQGIADFLQQEATLRKERDYERDFQGTPTALWNRMSLYNRLLEYPVTLRAKVVELGAGTRKLVRAATTTVIMALFTYLLVKARDGDSPLSIALLLGIALVYAIRDLLREDMINVLTRWLREGKPRWKIRLLMPYTGRLLAQQRVWLDYQRFSELPKRVSEQSSKTAGGDDSQVICYRSRILPDKSAFEHDELRERLSLDCEALCDMIKESQDRLYLRAEGENADPRIQAHAIERQQDYHLLLLHRGPGQERHTAQRWRLRLGRKGIVECRSTDVLLAGSEEEKTKRGRWERLTAAFKRG